MKKQFFRLPESMSHQARNAFWSSIVLLAASGLNSVVTFRQALKSGVWQAWTEFGVVALFFVAILAGAYLNRRGRTYQAIGLLIGSFLFTIIARNALTEGLGVFYGLIAIAIASALAFFNLPRITANRVMTASIVLGGLLVLFDFIVPAYRQPAPPVLLKSLPYVASAVGLIFLILIIRQAWGGSLRTKLLAAFISVTVLATGSLSVFVIVTTTNNLRENMERELSALVVSRATRLGDLLDTQINTLTALTLNNALQQAVSYQNQSYTGNAAEIQIEIDAKDANWRTADVADNNADPLVREHLTNSAALNLIEYQKVFPDNAEVFITDVYGGLVGTTNRTSDYYQADETWWQAAYNNGQGAVYISEPQFDESTGKFGIQFALPLRNRVTGKVIGILRTTYVLTPLETVLKVEIGQSGEVDLFIPGETLIQIQDGALEEPVPELFEQLQAADQGMLEMDYEGYYSVVTQAQIKSQAGNPGIENLGWVAAFHQHRDEAFAPINTQIQGIIIVIGIVVIFAVLAAVVLAQLLVRPLTQLTKTAQEIAAGNLNSQAQVTTSDEIGWLASAFNTMTAQLKETLDGLESRVAERTSSLVLAAEVGRSVSEVRELGLMLKDAAEIIRSRFDLYYAQVYLTNPAQNVLLLQAGTGTVGAELVGRGHRLPLNTASINGRAAVEKHSVVISDTAASTTFRPNPLLPDTKSEMAVPLMVGEIVVGVLDLQSEKPGTLNQDILPAFEALAGQLAIAIQNANLLAETEQARAEVEAQARRLVRKNWEEHLDAIHRPEQTGFVFEGNKVTPLAEAVEIQTPAEDNVLSAPIAIANELLGSLVVEMDAQNQTTQNAELVNIVARQVAQQIENLRLLESAERYRSEAEEAARRTTIEGWEEYMESRSGESLGYLYDTKEVRPHKEIQVSDKSAMTLPIKAREETVGKLAVEGIEPGDKDAIDLANAVAERLGAHIDSLRLFEETKRGQIELDKRAHQLAAVAEISSVSAKELDIQKMLDTVVHLTQRQFGLYHAHIFTYNEDTAELKIAACGWKEGDEHEGPHDTASIPLDQEQSLVARAARTRLAVIVNNVHDEPGWLPNPLLPASQSEMAIPLLVGDTLLGVLDVQKDYINAFTDEDASIQTALASQVATALQNARSFAQAQQQAKRETMLNTISQKIQSATTVEAVLQIAARELGHALGAPLTIAQLGIKENSDNGGSHR